MRGLESHVIDTDGAFEGLAGEWDDLQRRVPNSTPFQSPRWLLPWWHVFGNGHPCVSLLRQDGRLAGILPLYVYEGRSGRKLIPIGAGVSDYLDALLEPQLGSPAAEILLKAALDCGQSHGATACDLPEIPECSVLRNLSGPTGWQALWQEDEICPVLRFPKEAIELEDVLPSHLCRKLRMNRHRAERRGGWSVEVATTDTLGRLLKDLARLHEARWVSRGFPGGVLADSTVLAFQAEVAPQLLSAHMLTLQALRMERRYVACCLALLAGSDRLFLYLSGFDPEFAHESPGSILLGEVIGTAMAEGRREIHFLRGNEAYKYSWGARPHRNLMCCLRPA